VRRLVSLAGVDFDQWWALTRALARIDFRPPGALTSSRQTTKMAGGLVMMAVIFGLFGVPLAVIVWLNADVLLTGSLTIAYLMTMVVTIVMAQHSGTITSAADYAILGVRPVSSRTFFAVRLTNVLIHTALPTAFMSWPSVIAFTIAHGGSAARGLGALAAIAGAWLATSFALIAIYGVIVAFVGAERLQRVLSYVQLIIGVMCYGGVFLMMEAAKLSIVRQAGLPREIWLLAVPPAWFASYLEIATGAGSYLTWSLAIASIVFLVAMFALLQDRLSLNYAEQLAAAGTVARAPAGRPVRTRAGWLFRRDEARAIALLVRAQFRHDLKFRLGILSIVPLTILYVFMGLREGRMGDPFVPGEGQRFGLLMMSVLMFPSLLAQHLASSDMYKAAWIYFATPADRADLVVAAKNVVAALFLGPYVLLLAGIFTWGYGHPGHALAHAAVLAMVGHVVLQIFVLVRPRLPFAMPAQKAQAGTGMVGVVMMTTIAGSVLLVLIHLFVFRSWWYVAFTAAVLAGTSVLLNRPIRIRAAAEDVLTAAE
jgi:hypothetical protein